MVTFMAVVSCRY